MSEKLFFSQDIIDAWSDEEKVHFENNVLTIQQDPPTSFHLTTAYRIVAVSGGEPDPHGWVNKVMTKDELEAKGADIYMESVLFGEIAYDVESGYLAQSGAADGPAPEGKDDAALLTEFLLTNL